MLEVEQIKIEENDRDYIQYLHFERSAYQDILSYILLDKAKGYEYNLENYNHFMNEYKEANMKFHLVMSDMVAIYAPKYHGDANYSASCNFEDSLLIIYKREVE